MFGRFSPLTIAFIPIAVLIAVYATIALWLISPFWALATLAVTIGSIAAVGILRYSRGIRAPRHEHRHDDDWRAMEPDVLSLNAYPPRRWPPVEIDSRSTTRTAQRRPHREEVVMFTCIICCFAVEYDDVISRFGSGRCVCLRCFARETGSERPMPQALRRQIIQALSESQVA